MSDTEVVKTYLFKGVRWQQGILTYDEFGRVLKILKGEFNGLATDRKPFEDTIDRWYESGRLKELYKVILKPAPNNLWQRIKHKYLFMAGRVSRKDPITNLDLHQMAIVNQDFFLLNSEWIGNLMLTQRSLELSTGVMTTPFTLQKKNSSIGSAAEVPQMSPS